MWFHSVFTIQSGTTSEPGGEDQLETFHMIKSASNGRVIEVNTEIVRDNKNGATNWC